MPNLNSSLSRAKVIAFIDYKPAELRMQKEWMIVYYAKNPLTQNLERIRLRAPVLANLAERKRHANRIVAEINKKLAEGWSPFMESPTKNFKTFKECCEKFMEQLDKEIKDGIKREDTRRAYKSYLSMINTFIAEKKIKVTFALEINKVFAVNYLDWIYYDRENSPTTYNNHLTFLHNFGEYLINRGYLKENPTIGITKKPKNKKKRLVLTAKVKTLLREKLPLFSVTYNCLCMTTYYALLRRTELTKIKVKDVDLNLSCIMVTKETAKSNSDTEWATIPEQLKILLTRHLDGANANDYVFSANDFKPGAQQLAPKKITDTWSQLREHLGLPKEFQFYSLKDTGITDLFEQGVSSINIRDQARHKDLKTTEIYTPTAKAGNAAIKNSGINFK